ncbi:hypothetical protein [Massilia sp. Leaf139]|uniref:hypothetical protein n=1 Tax=Massilia sp. Leaf139 TaxID=1736272 RepID=UPI0006F6817C|nr:hypothetical protein [Massilia sp. Leaf139]KQQ87235.1 hypothetical protein ASF77_16750 [Massilia sp. Leaf139]
MLKQKLNWRRPLFYLLLPILLIMVFLGFPLPVAPPPAIKTGQEISTVKKKKRVRLRGLDLSDEDKK